MLSPLSHLPRSWSPLLSRLTAFEPFAAFDELPFQAVILRFSHLFSDQPHGTRAWPSSRRVLTRRWSICARKWQSARYGRDCGGAVRGKSWTKEKSGGKHIRMRVRGKSRTRENGREYLVGKPHNYPLMLFDYCAGDFVVSECFKIRQKLVEIIVILTFCNAISKVYSRLTSHLIA